MNVRLQYLRIRFLTVGNLCSKYEVNFREDVYSFRNHLSNVFDPTTIGFKFDLT